MTAIGWTNATGRRPVVLGQDLLPAPVLSKRATAARAITWTRITGGTLAVLALVYAFAPDHGRRIEAATDARDAARVELRAIETQQASVLMRQRQLESSLVAWDRAAGRLDWSGLLHAVAAACSPEAALSAIELTPPDRDTGPYTLVISGTEQSHAAVSSLTLALERIPVLQSVALRRADRIVDGERERVRFTLACEVGLQEGTP